MPSQAEIEPYTSQSAPPAPEYFHQSPEWAQDQKIKNQGIMVRSRRDFYANMHVNNFDEQSWPSRNLTTQQHILHQDFTSWYDSRSITRLPDREPGLFLSLHDTDELVQHGNVLTSHSREHPTILEINKLSENDSDDEAVIASILKLGTYPSGWNRPDTIAPLVAAINDAAQFARHQDLASIYLPSIGAADDGEVNFWWDVEGLYIDLGFFGDGSYSFYARLPNGKEITVDHAPLSQPLPPEILQCLKKSG